MMSEIPVEVGQIIAFTIERLAFGGSGVGRYKGFTIFVPGTAPQEQIKAQVIEVKKNFAEGHLVEIVAPSNSRVLPRCPVAKSCGGCDWQHVDYLEQLRQKQQILEYSLKKLNTTILPIIASPKVYRYRNRIQIRTQNHTLGYFKRGSHDIVDIDDCPIADERITKVFSSLRSHSSEITKIEIHIDEAGKIITSKNQAHGEEIGFTQVNTDQNNNMVSVCVSYLKNLQISKLVELFSGAGNFTVPIAQAMPNCKVVGVEINPFSIKKAQEKVALFKLTNVILEAKDALKWLQKNPLDQQTAVLIDPPRTGCDEAILHHIKSAQPEHFMYISCNPTTFLRDTEFFLDGSSYEIESIQPFDMFPHTSHIELIAIFSKK